MTLQRIAFTFIKSIFTIVMHDKKYLGLNYMPLNLRTVNPFETLRKNTNMDDGGKEDETCRCCR